MYRGPIDYGLPEPATFIEYKKADNNEYETKKENKTKLEFIEKTVSTMKTEPGIIIKTEPGSTGDAPGHYILINIYIINIFFYIIIITNYIILFILL